jgi:Fic family protein
MLADTPYLISDDSNAGHRFNRVLARSAEVQQLARNVGQRIQEQAADVFESFGLVLRSELVAESNRIERINWTPQEVREEVLRNRELLELPVHVFMESIRADERVYEALGLYRAQLLAEEWAAAGVRPREIEIRQLHSLITAGAHYAGRYKIAPNEIVGSQHTPPAPAEAAEGMRSLAKWWETGTGDPALDASVAHAWLVHLHPFEDGNERLARLLANLALSQDGYPPLVIQADSDRGEYYDALALSDDGDILQLFALFTRVLRRSVRRMGQPDYVERVIRDRMLTSPTRQQQLWEVLAQAFTREIRQALRQEGFEVYVQGYPSGESFIELADSNPDGNSWYLKVTNREGEPCWLLWFGFNTFDYADIYDGPSGYPSIFLSSRNLEPGAIHPYTPVAPSYEQPLWTELVLVPGRPRPARLLVGPRWHELTAAEAGQEAARLLVSAI